MRLVLTFVLAATSLLAATDGVGAQESTPGRSGQRIDVATAGYALTFPAGWHVFESSRTQLDVVLEEAGFMHDDATGDAVRQRLARTAFDVLAFPPAAATAAFEMCLAWGGPTSPSDSGQDALAALHATIAALPTVVDGPTSSVVDLPAGEARRIDFVDTGRADDPDDDLAESLYVIVDPEGFYVLACSAAVPPADRWRSIAESFERTPSMGRDGDAATVTSWSVFLSGITDMAHRQEEFLMQIGLALAPSEPGMATAIGDMQRAEALIADHIAWLDDLTPMPCYRSLHTKWRAHNIELLAFVGMLRRGFETEDTDLIIETMAGASFLGDPPPFGDMMAAADEACRAP